MGKQMLKITVAKDGSVSVEVVGVAGAACLGETKFLEDAMGGGVTAQEVTEEYYAQAEVTHLTEGVG